MLRSWLPNYQTVAKKVQSRAGGAGSHGAAVGALALGGTGVDQCYIQVGPFVQLCMPHHCPTLSCPRCR